MKKIILGLLVIVLVLPVFAAVTPIVVKEGRVLDRFYISDIDTTTSTREYFGFVAEEGDWYILRMITSNPDQPSIRYAGGKTGYVANWTSREALSYLYFNNGN